MNNKETGLESFIERHRADFDAFEPRPDLWDDIEQQLAAPTASAVTPVSEEAAASESESLRIVKLYPDTPEVAPAKPTKVAGSYSNWLPRPSVAAAVALLLMAGASAVWNNQQRTTGGWANTGTSPLVLATPSTEMEDASAGLYFGASPVANSAEAPQHLNTAVRRMETYYAAEISERQNELRQLEAATAVASAPSTADWRRELASLDSTYRQLKVELYRNPEPDVVLEAMNRNLQIRLDILNQQTRTREQVQEYHAQPMMVADNRQMP